MRQPISNQPATSCEMRICGKPASRSCCSAAIAVSPDTSGLARLPSASNAKAFKNRRPLANVVQALPSGVNFTIDPAPGVTGNVSFNYTICDHGEGTPAGTCTSKEFQRGLRVLDEMGLSFDLCMRHAELPDAVRVCEALPNLRLILDHLGNPNTQASTSSGSR